MTTPDPHQAAHLLDEVESAQLRARSSDAWPLVSFLFSFSAAVSIGLVAIGLVTADPLQLIALAAAGAWLLTGLLVYLVKALSWSRRSTALLLIWLPLILFSMFAALIADGIDPGSWVPYAAAGFLWVIAPVFAVIGLRR